MCHDAGGAQGARCFRAERGSGGGIRPAVHIRSRGSSPTDRQTDSTAATKNTLYTVHHNIIHIQWILLYLLRQQRHAAIFGEQRQVLQIVLLNTLVHVVDLAHGQVSINNLYDRSMRCSTWKELTRVERPNICAVSVMVVSLSNMPCVSISNTASFSPDAVVVRIKGSDHIQMPVVCRSWPPRQAKLFSCLGTSASTKFQPSFMFPSDSSSPVGSDRKSRKQRNSTI